MFWSRRGFLAVAVPAIAGVRAVAAGQSGLGQFAVSAPPCKADKPTPSVPADSTYRAGSPLRTSLIEAGTPGTRLTLTGTVIGLSCGRVKGATVDFWQADDRGVYDATGMRFRGHQLTDADGRYRLDTIVPGASANRAPHISVNVRVAGKANFWTELFFPDRPENAKDPRVHPELVMQVTGSANARAAIFDILLDI